MKTGELYKSSIIFRVVDKFASEFRINTPELKQFSSECSDIVFVCDGRLILSSFLRMPIYAFLCSNMSRYL